MPEKKLINKLSNAIKHPSMLLNQTSKPLLLNIIQSLPGSIYWKDSEGRYLGCNQVVLEMAGMKSIIGKTDFDMPWAESAQTIRDNDLKVIALNSTLELEETLTIANGQHIIVLTRKTPLLDEHGAIVGIIGTSLNITHRKKQESDLRATQEITQSTLENIVANMPGHVYWKDKNGVYLGCNNRQAKSLGFQYGYEIVGKTDFDLPWGENKAELFRQTDRHIIENGETEIIEEKSQVDGKSAIVLSHKSPMRDTQGKITGLLGISIDISDRKKIEAELHLAKEQAEAANHSKTEFLENMRHDIRTPLTGIIGFSDIIKEEADNPQIKEYADNLVASSHALLDLMDAVLEAIRVSSGDIPKVKKKFVLQTMLQQALDLYKAKASAKKLKFSLDFDETIPKYLVGDNIRIHRIALELLANALNFTDVGFVKLTAKLASRQNREVIIKLVVTDSGMGIPKDKQQEIFLQFKRLTPSYQGIYKGAGLGLAVIKQFIDELDGEIYVDSELQKGTTFTCVIPLKVSLLEDDTGLHDDFETYSASFVKHNFTKNIVNSPHASDEILKHRILVVEDNIIAQTVAKAILTKLSCQVDIAGDGQAAIHLWEQNKYDLIFMDIGLPDMDGYQVTHHIRAQEITENHHTPIIALTAHVGEENKQRCIESGMNAVISKPLSQKSCSDILGSFLPLKLPENNSINQHTIPAPFETEDNLFQLSFFPMLDVEEGITTTGSEDMLCEMLQFMLKQSLPDDIVLLKNAHDTNDWEKTQSVAHKIKGGVVYVGAVRLKMACQYLQHYWKTGERELLEQLYQQLLKVTDESISEIEKWLKNKVQPE